MIPCAPPPPPDLLRLARAVRRGRRGWVRFEPAPCREVLGPGVLERLAAGEGAPGGDVLLQHVEHLAGRCWPPAGLPLDPLQPPLNGPGHRHSASVPVGSSAFPPPRRP